MTSIALDDPYLERLKNVNFQPIFILGDHRSGTTLLYKTLADSGCFNVVTAYHIIQYEEIVYNHIQKLEALKLQELTDKFKQLGITDRVFDTVSVTPQMPEEYGFILRNAGYENYLNSENLAIFLEACRKVQFTANCQNSQKPLLLKNPWCYPHFKFILQALPNAKFIFIHRNPVHVINSKLNAVSTVLSDWNPYTGLISRKYNKIFKSRFNRFIYQTMYSQSFNLGINKVLEQSRQSTSYFLQNIVTLPAKTYLSLRFEDFCDQPQAILENLFDFLTVVPEQPTDHQSVIQRRPVQLLPTVEKNQTRIQRQLAPYFDFHGYRI